MIRWLDFLLVLFLVYQCGILPVGNDHITETGEQGGNVTLICEFKDHNIFQFELHNQTGDIVCDKEECPSKFDKKGLCDVIIKDLIFSDAGKYTLKVYYNNTDQSGLEPNSREYHLHIHANISAKTGQPFKLDVLYANAAKVEKNSSGEWTEVWTRGHGVSSDRLNESHGNLIIKTFMHNDTGTYRVLDSEGEIWVTVTVTESGSKEGQRNTKNDAEQQNPDTQPNLNGTHDHGTNGTVENWPLIVGVSVGVVVLILVAVALFICVRRRHQPTSPQHQQQENNSQYEVVPMHDLEQEAPAEH